MVGPKTRRISLPCRQDQCQEASDLKQYQGHHYFYFSAAQEKTILIQNLEQTRPNFAKQLQIHAQICHVNCELLPQYLILQRMSLIISYACED